MRSGEPVQNPNVAILSSAVEKPAPLLDHFVLVGGCATGFLITDSAAAPIRPTLDIDAIVELASYADLVALEEQLRELGFQSAMEQGAPVCRWKHQDTILDLMPTNPRILGFGSRWYSPALRNAKTAQVGNYRIRVITAPYFLATKLDAFAGRGGNDYRLSRDLEDIVAVLDGRAEIVGEVQHSDQDVRAYLGREFSRLLQIRDFVESLSGHLLPDAPSQQRIGIVVGRIRQIAGGS